MDTVGGLVDKLSIVNLKMWNAQEIFYDIRHMTFEEFKTKFFSEKGMEELWRQFQAGMDLNLQRNALIDELDERVVALIMAIVNNEEINGRFIQRKHKSY